MMRWQSFKVPAGLSEIRGLGNPGVGVIATESLEYTKQFNT